MTHIRTLALATAWAWSLAAQATPIALSNGGFEADWTGASIDAADCCARFVYGPTGPGLGWNFGVSTGIAWYFNQPPTLAPYEGSRFAFLQTETQPLSQVFTLADEADVTVSFAAALRSGRQPGQTVQVEVDGVAMVQANVDDGWTVYGAPLGRLGAGAHTLSFRGISSFNRFGDTTAFLDAVTLDARASTVPEPATLGLALAALALATGRLRSPRRGCTDANAF